MSARANAQERRARVFAALGDETRLALVERLREGEPCSISELTKKIRMSRQGVTKHLRVLEGAGLVRGVSSGRENLFQFVPDTLGEVKSYIDLVAAQWDVTLGRLKSFVEE